jgi:hypothetical protein
LAFGILINEENPMHMLYEGHPAIESQSQGWEFIQTKPEVLPEPVLKGAADVDGLGVSIYGSVLQDGGRFRMWYQAKAWDLATIISPICPFTAPRSS